MLWLRAKSKSPCIHLNLFIFENEDWQIISHQLNPQNTSWRPLHSDLEQTTESVDDGVCCWLSLTPAGMLLPSSRYPTSIFICTERQRLTPFIRMMSKDAHNNEICKSFCESISSKSLNCISYSSCLFVMPGSAVTWIPSLLRISPNSGFELIFWI